ncbi:AEC family transporter [Nitrosophilus kaiyonis]|uniref:AEC family transporter n=1 Tax=Nitrosophilus kaiyonis TaxID=2930200 RepID=UPI00248FBFD0|nr:AEC family transporter [Nitrosophilus kaiyonis]
MIENILYLFLLFFLGILLQKKFEKNIDALIDFIIYISLPSLIISHIYKLNIDISFLKYIAFGWFITIFAIFLSFLAGKYLLKLPLNSLLSFIMVSAFANTAFVGYPYVETFLGNEALGYAIIYDNFASFLPVVTIGAFLLSFNSKDKKIDLKKIFTFPPFLVLIFSYLLKNFQIDNSFLEIFEKIGQTVTPLALFSVGAKIDFSKLKKIKLPIFFSLILKMILIPLISLYLLKFLFGINIESKAVLFEIAMPPMVLASIMVMKAKLDSNLAVGSVGFGVIFSFLTIPIFYKLLE